MISYVDVVRPASKPYAYAFDLFCIIGGTLFLALMAHLAFHLSFTPVPITMQTFAVLLMGALLGSKRGALVIIAYLAEGAMGLPVFSTGPVMGLAALVGPKGGYLLGFVMCAFVVGYLLERGWRHNYLLTTLALVLGSVIVLVMGASWLSLYVGGFKNALVMGVYPFLIGDAIKIGLAAALIPTGWKFLK